MCPTQDLGDNDSCAKRRLIRLHTRCEGFIRCSGPPQARRYQDKRHSTILQVHRSKSRNPDYNLPTIITVERTYEFVRVEQHGGLIDRLVIVCNAPNKYCDCHVAPTRTLTAHRLLDRHRYMY